MGDAGLGSALAQLPSGAAQRKGPHCDSGEADAGAAVRGMPTKPRRQHLPANSGRQGPRSNVGTLMSTVSTLGVLTLALILLLAQCANTF